MNIKTRLVLTDSEQYYVTDGISNVLPVLPLVERVEYLITKAYQMGIDSVKDA